VGHRITFPGSYQDAHGTESVEWSMSVDFLKGWDIRTTIRGIGVVGDDWDSLEVSDYLAARSAGMTATDEGYGPIDCRISGQLPCAVEADGERAPVTVDFTMDLDGDGCVDTMSTSMEVDGVVHTASGTYFSECLDHLARIIAGKSLVCCATCMWSGNFRYHQPTMRMLCRLGTEPQMTAFREISHRYAALPAAARRDRDSETRGEFLRARNRLPEGEAVTEFHLCPRYERHPLLVAPAAPEPSA